MREKYESLSAVVLRDLAKSRGLKNLSGLKKAELVELMLAEDERVEAQKAKEEKQTSGRENGRDDTKELDSGVKAHGILEVMPDGYGFIRCENYLPGENDVYVSPSQIRKFNLKTGDIIAGNTRIKTQGEKFSALLYITSINDLHPSEAMKRKNFEDLTPVFPNERLRLETPGGSVAMRITDLVSPIGKGQRGMIVSPGELPEHKRFIYETAIPYFEKRGIPTRVLRGQKTYLDCFYHIVSRGNAEGKLASFPLTGRCSIQRDCKLPPIRTYQKTLPQDTVYYLGIAADEPIRLARLKANQTSLLAKYNLTEKDAWAMCQAEGLLSPLYAFTGRGGCWFCPNASMRELRHLYNAHPDLWQLLLELQDAPNKATERFNRSYTLHDLDLRFCLEGEQLSLFSYGER